MKKIILYSITILSLALGTNCHAIAQSMGGGYQPNLDYISDELHRSGIVMYPNPANNETRVILPYITRNKIIVSILDLNGNIWQSQAYAPGGNAFDVDVTMLPSGIYSLRIQEYGYPPVSVKLVKH